MCCTQIGVHRPVQGAILGLRYRSDRLRAFAQRALWVDQPSYMTTPYPSFQRRFDLAVAATRGDVLTPGGAAELLRLQRPLFVVSYQARDRQLGSRLEARYGPPVFAADFVAVYRFAP